MVGRGGADIFQAEALLETISTTKRGYGHHYKELGPETVIIRLLSEVECSGRAVYSPTESPAVMLAMQRTGCIDSIGRCGLCTASMVGCHDVASDMDEKIPW